MKNEIRFPKKLLINICELKFFSINIFDPENFLAYQWPKSNYFLHFYNEKIDDPIGKGLHLLPARTDIFIGPRGNFVTDT